MIIRNSYSYPDLVRLHVISPALGDVRQLSAGRLGQSILLGIMVVELGKADLHYPERRAQTMPSSSSAGGLRMLQNPMGITEVCRLLLN